jgi:acetate kinase
MADAIGVLNAGSSSIKFSLFIARGNDLELELHGQIESIYTTPHFIAKRRDGTKVAEKSWDHGSKLGHDGASIT